MSYSIDICDKHTKETVYTYGTHLAEFNITYNYYDILVKLFGEKSIRKIYGKDIQEAQQILLDAYNSLPDEEPDSNYYKSTNGNVKVAIKSLIDLANEALLANPETEMIWDGD